jgi:very-short-patch-repair endonuclease
MARTDQHLLGHARSMRKRDTAAEQVLWERLRNRRLADLKFVRQLTIGPFIADFACRSLNLIVEVDGATHGDEGYDARRTAWLERNGWLLVRVTNVEVFTAMEGVLETILKSGRG